jgi:hypothetical protein
MSHLSYTALVCPTVIGTDPNNLPVLLIGGSAGQLTGRRHIRYVTPMASLLVSVMDKLGVPVDKIGNSTGNVPIEPLSLV